MCHLICIGRDEFVQMPSFPTAQSIISDLEGRKNKDEKGRNKIQRFPEISFPINLSSLDLSQPKKPTKSDANLTFFYKETVSKSIFLGSKLKMNNDLYWIVLSIVNKNGVF